MSDVDVMAALIEQHARANDPVARHMSYRVTASSARKAAEALHAAGFRQGAGTVDREQNDRLKAIESRLDRIEGYMVIT
ncbi:hypothetical protein SEA_DIMINIMUS_85 [Mycobacterium phage Diminimus]|uniref:Uncharacterized protein n=6 Tax=Bongovirus bongo TaxID=1983750 RepID=A0A0M3UKD9_9CAUD|nr:hypothetical protein PEGLEG_83 [Mycobacterium phage PegLeg]YP_009604942.1 hypothetical protein FDH95_gp084 [Mycobacterium phage Bongo]ALF00611.1 hypothetical protein SEA_BRICOLE_83 [Mycobacterium phage Bricole]AXQ52724.1 hypothetical protein SEA_IPHANE7_83 [Mycobacterium phage IPhane7]QDH93658.1 hypothetical protein SEA_LILHOMIEP_84 [Mycobacterium phage LilhomieP]QGJ93229.1 hypothetical protein SEA_TYDAWG_84 [Mycobacterium phage TyDawg]WNM75296.1 hypothetical protein SEA_AUSPICE_84 [Mycoba